jgi:hypothetical protein
MKNSYTITYTGKGLSLNQVKSQNWQDTERQKKAIMKVMSVLILQVRIQHMRQYRIDTLYNSRLDPDNVTPMVKILCDIIRRKGYTIDDSKKYWKGFSIAPDATLPHNTYQFTITEQ